MLISKAGLILSSFCSPNQSTHFQVSLHDIIIKSMKLNLPLKVKRLIIAYSKITFNPANIRLDEDVFRVRLQNTSWRRLHQDEFVRICLASSEDVLVKTNIFVLAIRLQDVFKTFSRRLQDVFKTSYKNVFQTSLRRLAKISSRRFQDVSSS